jgi:hypothetical protein
MERSGFAETGDLAIPCEHLFWGIWRLLRAALGGFDDPYEQLWGDLAVPYE